MIGHQPSNWTDSVAIEPVGDRLRISAAVGPYDDDQTLPVAPPRGPWDPWVARYTFVMNTGRLMGIEFPLLKGKRVNLRGLDLADFWRRGGPVCWMHRLDVVIGRTIDLRWEGEGQLVGTMVFADTAPASAVS